VRNIRNLPERIRETIVRLSDGTYRARGANWDVRQPIEVWLRRPGQNAVRVDLPATRTIDAASGVVASDSGTGGKIYMDPHTGKVSFSNPPSTTAQLELRYTPRVIRISELGSTAGHTNPSSILDQRFDWNKTFYSFPGSYTPIGNAQPRVARMWHFYQRGASGPGQSRRPYLKTQRPALRTNYPIALDGNGNPMINVIGMASPFYQVDPSGGKIYFGLQDEGRQLTVTYWYRNDNGSLQFETVNGRVQWQVEYAEQPVPIEQAVDEDSVFVAPDLFDDPVNLRTGLVWVFFTSTRGGTRDVYYISVAPRLGPIVARG
jgi:hypothetical protein